MPSTALCHLSRHGGGLPNQHSAGPHPAQAAVSQMAYRQPRRDPARLCCPTACDQPGGVPMVNPPAGPDQAGARQGLRGRLGLVWLAGLLVAVGAGVATAHGLYEVALAAGVPRVLAWLYPIITD